MRLRNNNSMLNQEICQDFDSYCTYPSVYPVPLDIRRSLHLRPFEKDSSKFNLIINMICKFGRSLNQIDDEYYDESDFIDSMQIMDMSEDNFPFFENVDEKWGWKHEILLLEFVRLHGLHSWRRISKLLNLTKQFFGVKEVEDHFKKCYLEGTLGHVWNYSSVYEDELKLYDHTVEESDFLLNLPNKYYPRVSTKDLRSIKFLPHREEFQDYEDDDLDTLLSDIDFTINVDDNQDVQVTSELTIKDIMIKGQLAIVDRYRRVITEREKKVKFIQDFKLIEQFFSNGQSIMTRLKSNVGSPNFRKLNTDFTFLLKYARFFDSLSTFYNFYHDVMKETLIKMEIRRLKKMLTEKTYIKREPLMFKLMNSKAPFFLNAGLMHSAPVKQRRKNQKSKFTRQKQTK